MLSLSSFSTSARAAESDPTIVLVHGAFASPAGWGRVADALHKDGYETATAALGLASVSDDVAVVQATLDSIPGDKILVGHSYGGFVISNAASGRSDVRGLVYTAAYVPDTDRAIDPDLQRFMAQRAGSTTVQFDDASHVGGLTHYATRFVKLIEQAIHATAS